MGEGMMEKLLIIASCGGAIREDEVEEGFFSKDWTESAIKEGLLKRQLEYETQYNSRSWEYSLTPKFWKIVREKITPVKNTRLEYFFKIKST